VAVARTETVLPPDSPALESTRRRLTPRQAEVVTDLVRATVEEVETVGYDGLTVRNVARRAGVAPATAYTYFGSKDHLLAEVLWRRMQALPPVETTASLSHEARLERLDRVVHDMLLITENPALADACTVALLDANPDVKHLRDRIGALIHRRLEAALGPEVDPLVVGVLETSFIGAMLSAGMKHMSYRDIPALLSGAATLMTGDRPSSRRTPGER
jgi:AcrR family transcriptional regulator